jgi:hypothetical protein
VATIVLASRHSSHSAASNDTGLASGNKEMQMSTITSHIRFLLAGLILIAGAALFTGTAFAQFSDGPFGAGFTDGSLAISGALNHPLFGGRSVVPGDYESRAVMVSNTGSLALRYAATSTTTDNVLAGELQLTIWQATGGAADCDSTPDATPIYGPAPLGRVGGLNTIGDPAQGSQPGDRTLAAGDSETLCFAVSAPLSMDNSVQGLTTTPAFDFLAEQVHDNP